MPRPSRPDGARQNGPLWCPRRKPRPPACRRRIDDRGPGEPSPRRPTRRASPRSALAMRIPVLHLLVVVALVASVSPAAAKKKDQPPKDAGKPGAAAAAPAAAPVDKPFAEWGKFTKDSEQKKGFLTTWKKRDNLYVELSPDQMEKPFLYVVSLSKGIGSNFILGGLPLDDRMLQFERHGDRVFLVQVNTWITAPDNTPIGKALAISIPNSIV